MTTDESRVRRQTRVYWSDDDFAIRAVTMDALVRIQRDDVVHGWSRRWSSEEALARQVSPYKEMFLCPLFRNGGPVHSPESYRCWFWFAFEADPRSAGVTLLTVGRELFETLPEISSKRDMNRVVVTMFSGITAGCQFESIW